MEWNSRFAEDHQTDGDLGLGRCCRTLECGHRTGIADRIVSSRSYASSRELVDRGILSQSTYEELERELSRREKFSA
jgi:hypothetical protein